MERDEAFAFQENVLAELSSLTYQELSAMQGRIDLNSPAEFSKFDFARQIQPDELGGLEVSVFHYWLPDESVVRQVEELLGESDISVGESQIRRRFNIATDGEIEWPNIEHENDED